ncbi:hypothetical protein GHK32_14190 [Staphylococcus aureus]|uniref:hypothetical protein n=1 Tax=Staphylococcus aureus TaxID=1280 RepID=UPI0015E5ECE6|nr:hypothetical protein [Staphylococcus aureus]MBA1384401.1 hypothetical protein [Staphylococcus aureus]MCQ9974092.1 hypothetical protein [Staphylococcus aureus]QPL29456.1 hypothetical protein I3K80_14140 [Staphylococcus aureus]
MIKIFAIFVTMIFIFCVAIIVAEFLTKWLMDKKGFNPKSLNEDPVFSKLFFGAKIIIVISFIGMLILWIQYWTTT